MIQRHSITMKGVLWLMLFGGFSLGMASSSGEAAGKRVSLEKQAVRPNILQTNAKKVDIHYKKYMDPKLFNTN